MRLSEMFLIRPCLGTLFCFVFLGACDAQTAVQSESTGKATIQASLDKRTISLAALSGEYIDAGAQSPLVLMVPGSGPTDKDGNNPHGVRSDSYKLLAEGLAHNGISTVRVDKRGMFGSADAGDPNAVTVELYADDYRKWANHLTQQESLPCIYLLGHSEGALMVSAAAVGQNNICGLILISGAGRKFGDILRAQLMANPANKPILGQAFEAITKLENGERIDTDKLHPALGGLFAAPIQGFLLSLMSADPAEIARQANKPTLIIQGDNDLQITVKDAELLADATSGQLIILEDVNHILKVAPTNRIGNLATYGDPDLPVSPEIVEAVTEFVMRDLN